MIHVTVHFPILVGILLALGSAPSFSQEKYRVFDLVNISRDLKDLPHIEPFIAVNPINAMNIAVASIVFRADGPSCDILVSTNGGKSWTRRTFLETWLDPWLAFGRQNEVFFSALKKSNERTPSVVYTSRDGGITWDEGTEVPFFIPDTTVADFEPKVSSFDHTSIVVIPGNTVEEDRVLLVGMQGAKLRSGQFITGPFATIFNPASKNFNSPRLLITNNVWSNTLNPVVLHDGALGIGYMDFGVDDGQMTVPISGKRIWWISSHDNAENFSIPFLISEVRNNVTLPLIAADTTGGEFRSRIYSAVDDRAGDTGGVFVRYSSNNGEQWSSAVNVIELAARGSRFANTVIAVNPFGVVGVAWYDGRNSRDSSTCWDIYFAASEDGGMTFLPNVRITPATFCTNVPGNIVRQGSRTTDVSRRWSVGGDYFGLSSDSTGRFHLVWADTRTGVYQLWHTKVEVVNN